MSGGELDDERWMSRALELAAKAAYRSSPNPMVGAVVLGADGEPAGEGWYDRYGAPHAEVQALERAGARARAGTLYVSLEPHGFQGPHSPPCTDAIIAAGITRVVCAMEDPDRRVRGDGLDQLRRAGIEVSVGAGAEGARRLNRFYVKQRTTGRPYVTLKWAMSVDGRLTSPPGRRWLTGEHARTHAHGLRNQHDAILVGVNTVLEDDPQLTTRLPGPPEARSPVRVVLDRHLRTPPTARALPAIVFADPDAAGELPGAEVLRVGTEPDTVLDELGRRELLSVLVEGGSQVLASFVPHADAIACYIAPVVLGSGETFDLDGMDATRLGPDILLEGDVHRDHH